MSVDYSANYGIGQQIKVVDFEEEENRPEGFKGCESFEEYLDDILHKEGTKDFVYFRVGESNYSGEQDDFFIEIVDVFSNGLDLTDKKKEFDKFIKKYNFETIGTFGLIGGLEVY